ncbi:MAG TPA: FUSC family protein [Candidatus Dormibacteraeota bacterium]|jgi:uncharacterized membrane protein YgaE (UPF0421/DUF939 family)|nr:FUSC family protein [Candidatus Dormibacteraeota bacterium]
MPALDRPLNRLGGRARQVRSRLRHLAWRLAELPRFLRPLAVQSLKIALASGLVWYAGRALHSPRPFAAVLTAIILMQGHAYGSLLNALEFLLGMVAGVILGILAVRLLGVSPVIIAAVIFVSMLIGGRLKVSPQGLNNQAAVSALLVLASGDAQSVERLWETVLGGAVGVVVALLWPPNPVRGLREEYREIRRGLEEDVRRTLELAGGDADLEANRRRVRSNAERADALVATIGPAEEALRWNPWHSGQVHDLSGLEDRLRLIAYLYRTVRALARQAAEAPRPSGDGEHHWEPSRPHLLAAGAACEAIERRLEGQDPREAVARGRLESSRFAVRGPRERHALALAAALDDLLTDVESWRPPKQVDPERRFAARLRRVGRRLGEQGTTRLPAVRRLRVPRPQRAR